MPETASIRRLPTGPRAARAAARASACGDLEIAARRRDLSRRAGEPVPWAFAAAVVRVEAELAAGRGPA